MPFAVEALQPIEISGNRRELSSNESAYSTGISPAAVRPIHILPHPSQTVALPPVPLSAAEKLKKLKRRHMY